MTSGAVLALREMRRAKLRFGLLTVAVGFLTFLIVFQQALLGQLVDEFVGAIRQQSADVLVYGDQARVNLQASVVEPGTVDRVAAVDGVESAGPLGVAAVTVRADGDLTDAIVVGYELDRPGAPRRLDAGRLPRGPGEAVTSDADEAGFAVGDEVVVVPGDQPLTIVGHAPGSTLSVTNTLYLDLESYTAIRSAQNPDAAGIPPSAVAVSVAGGREPARVAAAIDRAVDGVEAFDRDEAADRTPGVESVNQSLSLIVGLSFAVILIVTGFFFLILTVQKSDALTLLRALGAPSIALVAMVLTEALLVIVVGFLVGTGLSAWALTAPPFLGATLDAAQVATTLAVLLALGAVASLGSVRRVLRIEPVEATTRAGVLR